MHNSRWVCQWSTLTVWFTLSSDTETTLLPDPPWHPVYLEPASSAPYHTHTHTRVYAQFWEVQVKNVLVWRFRTVELLDQDHKNDGSSFKSRSITSYFCFIASVLIHWKTSTEWGSKRWSKFGFSWTEVIRTNVVKTIKDGHGRFILNRWFLVLPGVIYILCLREELWSLGDL